HQRLAIERALLDVVADRGEPERTDVLVVDGRVPLALVVGLGGLALRRPLERPAEPRPRVLGVAKAAAEGPEVGVEARVEARAQVVEPSDAAVAREGRAAELGALRGLPQLVDLLEVEHLRGP